jgi:hypothetical protein
MARLDLVTTALYATAWMALAATGCSDPPSPPARVGLDLNFANPTTASLGACNLGASTRFIVGGAPSSTLMGEPVTSGEENVEASCTVKGKSSGYSVSARIEAPDISLTLNGTVPRHGMGAGRMSVNAASIKRNVYSTQCSFDTAASPRIAGQGEMFATFTCSDAVQPSELGTACNLNGTIVLLRCSED